MGEVKLNGAPCHRPVRSSDSLDIKYVDKDWLIDASYQREFAKSRS